MTNHIDNDSSIVERFWKKVDKASSLDGCWLWTAACDRKGYGVIQVRQFAGREGWTVARAHRVVWEITNGPIESTVHLLHRCDNPRCVNPSHLVPGNHQDNMDDMWKKGRHRKLESYLGHQRGTQHPNAKINDDIVRAIRADRAAGMTLKPLGVKYGLHYSTISDICNGHIWAHVA